MFTTPHGIGSSIECPQSPSYDPCIRKSLLKPEYLSYLIAQIWIGQELYPLLQLVKVVLNRLQDLKCGQIKYGNTLFNKSVIIWTQGAGIYTGGVGGLD